MRAARLAWAYYYRECGIPIFPGRGKVPLTPHGFHDATLELAVLEQWWHQWPDANLCTPTGLHFWVLDEDPRSGGDATLHGLQQQYGALPHTLLSHTGGGG